MRGKFLIMTLTLLSFVLCAGANELANSGFEEELGESNWKFTWGSFEVEEWNNPPEGQWAGYIKGTWAGKGDSGGIIQAVEGDPSATYELSAQFYMDGGWSCEKQAFKLEFFDAEDNLLYAEIRDLDNLRDAQWTRKKMLVMAPEGTTRVQVVFEASGVGEAGVLGIDAVLLQK